MNSFATRLIAALALIGLAFILFGCKDKDRRRDRDRDEPRQEEPAGAIDFRSTTGRNVTESPNDTFAIPACGRGKLGYVVTRWPAPISGTMRLEYTFEASADAKVVDDEDHTKTPGVMALFFQRDGDDYSQSKYDRGYRQWSLPRQILEPGSHVFEVALTPDQWNFGHAGFEATKADVENVGFTLAGYGGASAGHGICMAAGTASITVRGLTVQ